jgi:hypothetical protein
MDGFSLGSTTLAQLFVATGLSGERSNVTMVIQILMTVVLQYVKLKHVAKIALVMDGLFQFYLMDLVALFVEMV